MDVYDLNFDADTNCVLQFLRSFPGQFVSEMEIARRAEGRRRFTEDARWTHSAISQLLELNLIETDGHGRYRYRSFNPSAPAKTKKYIDPKLRVILEKSGRGIDLSGFA